MKLTILGGTGGVGRHLVTMAIDAGHEVTAFARNPHKLPGTDQIRVVEGELSDRSGLRAAIEGADAVLSAIGARSNTPDQVEVFSTAMKTLVEVMEELGVRRLVAISGAGVILPDDHVTLGRRFVRLMLRLFAKHVAAAKEEEYRVIEASRLDWVLVRPPRIVRGPATGEYRVLPDRVPSPKISQGDVAHLMLECLGDDQWVRRGPIPGY